MLLFGQAGDLLHEEDEENAASDAEAREDVEGGLLAQTVEEEIGAGGHDQDAGPEHDTRHGVCGVTGDHGHIEPEK